MAVIRKREGKTGVSFQAIVRRHEGSKLVYFKTKTWSAKKYPNAEKLATDWACRLEAKLDAEGVAATKTALTRFKELIEKYKNLRKETKKLRRTAEGELGQLEYWLGEKRLDELTPGLFSKFARDRRNEGAGPATVMHNLSTIRSILGVAKPVFGIDISPDVVAEAIKALQLSGHVSKSASRERRPTDTEIARLIEEFRRIAPYPSTEIPMEVFVPLAIAFPRRREELCEMKWVDLKDSVITLHDTKHPTKPRTERVPVPPAALKIIETLPKIDERIFPYKPESVSAAFQRAVKRLEIEDLRLHDLRHEGICRLFEQGLGIQEVALISGHTSWATLKRYTHLKPENVLEKLERGSAGK